jgi:hypothetical protein
MGMVGNNFSAFFMKLELLGAFHARNQILKKNYESSIQD